MFKKVTIQNDERGLLFRKGSYYRSLQPGTYRLSPFSDDNVEILNIMHPFHVKGKDLQLFMHDEILIKELDIVQVLRL